MSRYEHIPIRTKKQRDEFVSVMTRLGLLVNQHRKGFSYFVTALLLALLASYGFWTHQNALVSEENEDIFTASHSIKPAQQLEQFVVEHPDGHLQQIALMHLVKDHLEHHEWDPALKAIEELSGAPGADANLKAWINYNRGLIEWQAGHTDKAEEILRAISEEEGHLFQSHALYQLAVMKALAGDGVQAQNYVQNLSEKKDLPREITAGLQDLQTWLDYQKS